MRNTWLSAITTFSVVLSFFDGVGIIMSDLDFNVQNVFDKNDVNVRTQLRNLDVKYQICPNVHSEFRVSVQLPMFLPKLDFTRTCRLRKAEEVGGAERDSTVPAGLLARFQRNHDPQIQRPLDPSQIVR